MPPNTIIANSFCCLHHTPSLPLRPSLNRSRILHRLRKISGRVRRKWWKKLFSKNNNNKNTFTAGRAEKSNHNQKPDKQLNNALSKIHHVLRWGASKELLYQPHRLSLLTSMTFPISLSFTRLLWIKWKNKKKFASIFSELVPALFCLFLCRCVCLLFSFYPWVCFASCVMLSLIIALDDGCRRRWAWCRHHGDDNAMSSQHGNLFSTVGYMVAIAAVSRAGHFSTRRGMKLEKTAASLH